MRYKKALQCKFAVLFAAGRDANGPVSLRGVTFSCTVPQNRKNAYSQNQRFVKLPITENSKNAAELTATTLAPAGIEDT